MDRDEREEQQPRTEQDQDDQEHEVGGADGVRAEGHFGDDDRERPEEVEGGSQGERPERAQPEHRVLVEGSETERLSSDSMDAPDGRDVVPDYLRIHEGEEQQVQAHDQKVEETEVGRNRFEQQSNEQTEGGGEPSHGEAPVEVAEDSTDARLAVGPERRDLFRVASDVKSRMSNEPQQVHVETDRQDDQRNRSPEREREGAPEDGRNGLIPVPAAFDQVREEVTRPRREEGEDYAGHGIRERDRADRTLDERGPVENQPALSPGLPDRSDAARWQFGSIRPCRPCPVVSECMLPRDATLRSRGSSMGSMNVPIRPSTLKIAPSAR